MPQTLEGVEFTDRYGGRPPPWLRGCWGDCEATGFYPEPDPRLWPMPASTKNGGLGFVKVEPGWDPRGEARVGGLNAEEWEWALSCRDYWVPGTALDDGWPFLRCMECEGTGSVSRWQIPRRLPRFLRQFWGLAVRASGGPVDDPWGTRRFALVHFPRELWRALWWRS